MERDAHRARDLFGVAIVAALVALALAFGAQRGRRPAPVVARGGDVTELAGALARFTFAPSAGRLVVATGDGASRLDLALTLVVDDTERALTVARGDVQLRDKNTLAAELPIEVGQERATGVLELRMDPASDLLTVGLTVTPEAGRATPHAWALRASLVPEGRAVFVPGVGPLGDLGTTEGRAVLVDDDVHPFGLLSAGAPVVVAEVPPDVATPAARPRLVVTTRAERQAAARPVRLDLGVLVGASSQAVWGRLYKLLRVGTGRVSGLVTGTRERARVIALDDDARPQVRAAVDAEGRFSVDAPTTAVQWFAALEAEHTSAPVRFLPGTPWDLRLDVSPGGELRVRVTDADTGKPLVARLLVKGVDGTIDPSFGPDYRASGAGPLMDVLEGEVTTPLPAGRYRVAATKGIEWSIDAEIVEVTSGHLRALDLAIRHVVPTPGMVGCDLHVHARPSFDSPVTPEDRVLSLVSAGVDFAVPTEHNLVGDYAPALELLGLSRQLAHVPGVEVTTFNPRFGHFGVFPYPPDANVPSFRGTTAAALIASSRRGDPTRVVQVNHPRLPSGIGYFQIVSFDPRSGRIPSGMRTDFDTIEIYNGYDLGRRARVEQVMEDWYALLNLGKRMAATGSSDSHRIQYQWAGYPRTYALVEPHKAGDTGGPVDAAAVVAAIKKGRSFVSSGPIVDLRLRSSGAEAAPGEELRGEGPVTARLEVRAAPWIDVTSVDVVVGVPGAGGGSTAVVHRAQVPSRPTQLGKEPGSARDAAERTLRYAAEVPLCLPAGARWVIAVARGERPLDDALPFMPVQPFAFTNPVWLDD